MRLKLITAMQTPPKDRDPSFHYNETMLNVAFKIACDIETSIFEFSKDQTKRNEKFTSLIYCLAMKYTEIKPTILNGDVSVE